tara:strand:- start:98 stop:1216 length:1119 start_codon:yes stop_codon:yes gene_type:complete
LKKISFIFGTRPELIKLYPLINEFKKKNKFKITTICTSQHKELIDDIIKIFNIKIDYRLSPMKTRQTLQDISIKIFKELDIILNKIKPNMVFVQGDTTTATISSLLAFYKKIEISHIEAGLRTYDNQNPFPEEANRKIISSITTFHFAPTQNCKNNLIKEGYSPKSILVTGNTVVDTLNQFKVKIDKNKYKYDKFFYKKYNIKIDQKIILFTCHRRESFNSKINDIFNAIMKIALNNSNIQIVYPIHLNPFIKSKVNKFFKDVENIKVLPPLSYDKMIYILMNCEFLITDSGGLQEEAPSFKKFAIVTRDKTERKESIDNNISKIVGSNRLKIYKIADQLINGKIKYKIKTNPYGNGYASNKIFNFINNRIK